MTCGKCGKIVQGIGSFEREGEEAGHRSGKESSWKMFAMVRPCRRVTCRDKNRFMRR